MAAIKLMCKLQLISIVLFVLYNIEEVSSYNQATQNVENPSCYGSAMNKLYFNQSDGARQFVQFDTPLDDITSFHTCFWINFLYALHTNTVFQYVEPSSKRNRIYLEWSGGRAPRWSLYLNGIKVAAPRTPRIASETWHHVCLSWEYLTGEWSLFQDGDFIDSGINPKATEIVIAGGGIAGLSTNPDKYPRDLGLGLEGWLTLFYLDSHSLSSPTSTNALRSVRRVFQDCKATDRGDLIGWLKTPRKGFGGVTEVYAEQKCYHF